MAGATPGGREHFADAPDELLADRAGDGDAGAFAVLLRRHTPALRAYVRRVLGGSDEVDDVVQETFITAWDRLGSLEDRAAVRGWLFRIAYRRSMDRVRARRHHDDVAEHDRPAASHLEPEAQAAARSQRTALGVALAALPDDQRACWLLREAAGLSYAEIADELRMPLPTVRGTLARARRKLTEQMEAWR